MAHLTILRTYAEQVDPATLRPDISLCHTDSSVTIISDQLPKAYFHYFLVPLVRPPLRHADLTDLPSLLRLPREQAKGVLQRLWRDAQDVRARVEDKMREREGFVWGVQIGFTALCNIDFLPTALKHNQMVYAHIISTDFLGRYMNSKTQVNAFHPKLGFFLHLEEVLSWFDPSVEPTWFAMRSQIDKKEYKKLLKSDMTCPHCGKGFKVTPKMLEHLRHEFRDLTKRLKPSKKRARADGEEGGEDDEEEEPAAKRMETLPWLM